MPSYIPHLITQQGSPAFGVATGTANGGSFNGIETIKVISKCETQSRLSKRRVYERSMSEPLLLEPIGMQRRRSERRPRPCVQRVNSSSDLLENYKSKSCINNAIKPTRRGFYDVEESGQQSAPAVSSVVPQPTNRRYYLAKMKSCSALSNSGKNLRQCSKNLQFRAKILCGVLDDMGLFDDENDEPIQAIRDFRRWSGGTAGNRDFSIQVVGY